MLKWSDKYLVGIDSIDEQHRTFIENINRLGGLLRITNPSVEEARFILGLVDFLESYVADHFRHEEQCMERLRCPAYEINKKEHGDFLVFFRQFKKRWIAKGYSPQILGELHQRTSDWIQRHIMKVDRQIRQSVKESAKA